MSETSQTPQPPNLESLVGHLSRQALEALDMTTDDLRSFAIEVLPIVQDLIANSSDGTIDPKSMAYIDRAIETSQAIVSVRADAERQRLRRGAMKLATAWVIAALGKIDIAS